MYLDDLEEILKDKGIDNDKIHQYDEKHKRFGMYRTVRGMESSPEAIIANMQFEYLKKKAASGESFVIVGRCAEYVLRDCAALVSIFILGDKEEKINRVMDVHNLTSEKADKIRMEKDASRKKYHNQYCEGKWGDSRNYDISINSSKLGVDVTVSILINYIEARIRGTI